MRARYRVGKRGQTFVDYNTARAVADARGRDVWLVIGAKAQLALPPVFALVEWVGSLVYYDHVHRGRMDHGCGQDVLEGAPTIIVAGADATIHHNERTAA